MESGVVIWRKRNYYFILINAHEGHKDEPGILVFL